MIDHELDELKREFLAEAEVKVREMQAALEGSRTPESLDRLAYLAHQLKGSGGSYGYQRISNDAAELEKAVETLAHTGSDDAQLDGKILEHVTALRSEIDVRTRELGVAQD